MEPSLDRLSFAATVEDLGDSFCDVCSKLHGVLLPECGGVWVMSLCLDVSVRRVDMSGTVLKGLGGLFCARCSKLRDALPPGTLASLGP
jgi:hypothetical protein